MTEKLADEVKIWHVFDLANHSCTCALLNNLSIGGFKINNSVVTCQRAKLNSLPIFQAIQYRGAASLLACRYRVYIPVHEVCPVGGRGRNGATDRTCP